MKFIRALLLCAIGISFSAVLGAVADDVDGSEKVLSRQKRFKETGCTVTPETDEYEAVDESDSFTMECSFDSEVQACVWTHHEPMNEGESEDYDIICSGGPSSDGDNCENANGGSRIRFSTSGSKCGLVVSDSNPEDTGKWRLSAAGINSNAQIVDSTKEFTVYTYNQSDVRMYDEDMNEIDDWDAKYNYNDKQKKWEKGESNFERVEFTCAAYGGRPEPTFIWYIENNDNDDLHDVDHFSISDSSVSSSDKYGFIKNFESTIDFDIDDNLMVFLEEQGVDTNPKDEEVRFELNCAVEQGDQSYVQIVPIRMTIEKSYDNGALPADTIGIIVGVVIGVILLVLAIALLFFAKASNRWCFADDDAYPSQSQQKQGYHKANTGRSGGGGSSGGQQHGRGGQQQVTSATANSKSTAAIPASNASQNYHDNYNNYSSSSNSTPIIKKKPAAAVAATTATTFNTKNGTNNYSKKRSAYSSSSSSEDEAVLLPHVNHHSPPASSTNSNGGFVKKQQPKMGFQGEWLPKENTSTQNRNPALPPKPPSSVTTSLSSATNFRLRRPPSDSSSDNSDLPPPPLPKKAPELDYASLELQNNGRKSFMNDPRNQVLPMESVVRRQGSPTTYAEIVPPPRSTMAREMSSSSSRTTMSNSKYV